MHVKIAKSKIILIWNKITEVLLVILGDLDLPIISQYIIPSGAYLLFKKNQLKQMMIHDYTSS